MTVKRVLFAGEDREIRDFAAEAPRFLGDTWEALSAATGEEVFEQLERNQIDVLVSGSALVGRDGADLLREVREKYPRTVRFLVTEKDNAAGLLRSANDVHRFVPSPIDQKELGELIQSSLGLQEMLANEELRSRISAVRSLPSVPQIYEKIVAELKSENAPVTKIADLIGQDAAITAKLLQMVNSAFFGLRSRVESILQAINLLGLDTVGSIVFSAGVFEQVPKIDVAGFSIERMQVTSVSVGARARLIAHVLGMNRRMTEESLMGGMLHDVGKLLMLQDFQDEFVEALRIAHERSMPLYQAQIEVLGVTDAAMGAYLLSLWGLHDSIVEAVARHHRPSEGALPGWSPLTAVHLAYAIEKDESDNIRDEARSALDMDYLNAAGLSGQVPSLKGLAAGATA
ncbi:MAG: HDOD domain-containing protein [bacterium]|nr:HDOD domain-containing protein [bacterium]